MLGNYWAILCFTITFLYSSNSLCCVFFVEKSIRDLLRSGSSRFSCFCLVLTLHAQNHLFSIAAQNAVCNLSQGTLRDFHAAKLFCVVCHTHTHTPRTGFLCCSLLPSCSVVTRAVIWRVVKRIVNYTYSYTCRYTWSYTACMV